MAAASTKIVADTNARRMWRFLANVPPLSPGSIVVGPCGETVRILPDGGAEEVGPVVPMRRGVLVALRDAGRPSR